MWIGKRELDARYEGRDEKELRYARNIDLNTIGSS